MSYGVHWRWHNEVYVRAYVGAARANPRNKKLGLPCTSSAPMTALLSRRLLNRLQRHDSGRPSLALQAAAIAVFERLLDTYAGADLDHSVLMDVGQVTGDTGDDVSVIVVWVEGWFCAFAADELELGPEFYAEKVLFQTELRHRRESAAPGS